MEEASPSAESSSTADAAVNLGAGALPRRLGHRLRDYTTEGAMYARVACAARLSD